MNYMDINRCCVTVQHEAREWARVSRDGTVSLLDMDMAREAAKWPPGRDDVARAIAILVVEAFEMGRRQR
jgi:hypothetical protein